MAANSQTEPGFIDRRLSVAPMLDWTDRHCRYFHRLLAPDALLYTEMVTTGALIYGDRKRYLAYNKEEHPLALQLGGSDPSDLVTCAKMAEEAGYDEVNLNVGCPSDRVQKGKFGACLMLEPDLVRDCASAMQDAVAIPVTVKSRLGVDDHDSYELFSEFIGRVAESGCHIYIVHARKALLSGLSPKENRKIPELRYDWVSRLKVQYPELNLSLNGGIDSVAAATALLEEFDGVMLGRAAYQNPWILSELQNRIFGRTGVEDRAAAIHALTPYLERHVASGMPVKHVSRHVLGLFQGMPGAKRWRRYISENAHLDPANAFLLEQALEQMSAG
ncbi:MAG: tRNA dihydrouridine(20/20a) synthase DusA [Xanthomonadales bacterium]|jgi:tRNA-dihydrouridine synthase A|nr:tRNA dihydrouridine(20/20a) synthase DusA [Xanthomonadales bacterium]